MSGKSRAAGVLVLAGALAVAGGCAPLDALDGVGVGVPARASFVDGEVRSVDARRATLEIRDQWNRRHRVRFDRSTRVIYRQRTYPVTALERGDLVRVRVVGDRNGSLWADRVDVRATVHERRGVAVRAERISGTVSGIDARRGRFTLHPNRNQSLVVYLPPRMSQDDARRFQRLRRGDHVRVDVVPVGRGAVELVRFR